MLSFIAGHTPPEKRSLVVSGYLFQVGVLRLAGTSAYPAWAVRFADGNGHRARSVCVCC